MTISARSRPCRKKERALSSGEGEGHVVTTPSRVVYTGGIGIVPQNTGPLRSWASWPSRGKESSSSHKFHLVL